MTAAADGGKKGKSVRWLVVGLVTLVIAAGILRLGRHKMARPLSAVPALSCPSDHMLRVETVGGVGNQRECIINSVLLARHLGLRLVFPQAHPIFHPHQDFLRNTTKHYEEPFANRSTWGQMDLIFDRARFVEGMREVGVRLVNDVPPGVVSCARSQPRSVAEQLPSFFSICAHGHRLTSAPKSLIKLVLSNCPCVHSVTHVT
jgi:hypothetical protein